MNAYRACKQCGATQVRREIAQSRYSQRHDLWYWKCESCSLLSVPFTNVELRKQIEEVLYQFTDAQ